MRIYLASQYARRLEMEIFANLLKSLGFEIGSRWVWGHHDLPSDGKLEGRIDQEKQRIALEDAMDVASSDVVIFFSESPPSPPRGARHVEFGMALALRKKVLVVGPKENIFHWLPQVTHLPHFQAAVDYLQNLREEGGERADRAA